MVSQNDILNQSKIPCNYTVDRSFARDHSFLSQARLLFPNCIRRMEFLHYHPQYFQPVEISKHQYFWNKFELHTMIYTLFQI